MRREQCRRLVTLVPLILALLFAWPAAAQETSAPWDLGEAHSAEVHTGALFLPRVAADGGRTWQPGMAMVGGLVGSFLGGAIPVAVALATEGFEFVFFNAALMPLTAALGVHLFSDAAFGWELLGGFIGAVATGSVGVFLIGISIGGALGGGEAWPLPVFVTGCAVLVFGPAFGAWLAAKIDHNNRARFALLPAVLGSPRALAPGMQLVVRW